MLAWLSRRRIAKVFDLPRVQAAIDAAEKRTSGEIRVSIAPLFWGNVERAADKAFERLGMTATRQRNGVLFFIVPSRHRFVVLGDAGIHERVGQPFWEQVAAAMSERFHAGQFTEGLVGGIETAGEVLAHEFPHDPATDVDELPNAIDHGR
jgi:uncharacterized membrane protein